jgi:lysophospholipase L1-like esterase
MMRQAMLLAVGAALMLGVSVEPLHAGQCEVALQPVSGETASVVEKLKNPVWKRRVDQLEGQLSSLELSKVDVLLLGDSIVENWPSQFFPVPPDHVFNFGVRGDTSETLAWRMSRISTSAVSLQPKVVMVLIGVNEIFTEKTQTETVKSIIAIAELAQKKFEHSHILVLGIFPTGANPANPKRQIIARLNAALSKCLNGGPFTFIDPGISLISVDGKLTDDITYDYLHPTWTGYSLVAQQVRPVVARMLSFP